MDHSLFWLRPSQRITISKTKNPPALTGTLLIIQTVYPRKKDLMPSLLRWL